MEEIKFSVTEKRENLAADADEESLVKDKYTTLNDQLQDMISSMKDFCYVLGDTETKLRNRKGGIGSELAETNIRKKELAKEQQLINGVASAGNIITSAQNGSIAGFGSEAKTLGKSLMEKGAKTQDDELAQKLMQGGTAAAIAGIVLNGIQQFSKTYENALPGMDRLLANYGTIQGNSKGNSNTALKLRESLSSANKGTGLSTDDFVSLVNQSAKNGITDISIASQTARTAAMLQRVTGVDAYQSVGYAGLVSRFGGNGSAALETAYKAAKAQGLSNEQFGEFLDGVQNAMEQGISKGIKISGDEISKNLVYVAALSGNSDLWTGKYGAQRYNQMAGSMAANTNLQSTSSMLMFRAALGATGNNQIEALKFMEKGQWGNEEFLKSLKENLGIYGNDKMSKYSALKEMFGVNWTGAEEISKIIDNVGNNGMTYADAENKINEIKGQKEYSSDTTDKQDVLNSINEVTTAIGKESLRLSTGIQDLASVTTDIYRALQMSPEEKKAINVQAAKEMNDITASNVLTPISLYDYKEENFTDSEKERYEKLINQFGDKVFDKAKEVFASFWSDTNKNGNLDKGEVDTQALLNALETALSKTTVSVAIKADETKYPESTYYTSLPKRH